MADPTRDVAVTMVMRGIVNAWDGGSTKKDGVTLLELGRMIDAARADLNRVHGVRDAAVALCLWAWALRPDELHLARVFDVIIEGNLAVLMIPRSKGDRAGRGQQVAMHRTGGPLCPVTMLERWMRLLPPGDGPLFRKVSKTGRIGRGNGIDHSTIRRIVQRLAKNAGVDADVAGHSMRIGWATTAFEQSVPDVEIMRHLRHANIETTIGYNRSKIRPNLTKAVGL